MAHSISKKALALKLRKKGFSLMEISDKLHISKSTASVWLAKVELSSLAKKRLEKKQVIGQYKTLLIRKKLREFNKQKRERLAETILAKIQFDKNLLKLLCALLWWCEGNKEFTRIRFTSSDSTLINNFLKLFRKAFMVDESKFRALVHLHSYHIDDKQKEFWSKITKIPLSQFSKSYKKNNTAKRTKENYQGCITITYYDATIAKELESIYTMFSSINIEGS